MTAEAPLPLGAPAFHVELLDWGGRRGVGVHLPSTWQELIVAYLAVVSRSRPSLGLYCDELD